MDELIIRPINTWCITKDRVSVLQCQGCAVEIGTAYPPGSCDYVFCKECSAKLPERDK